MSEKITSLLDRIRELERDIDKEIDDQRRSVEAAIKAGVAYFTDEIEAQHRKLKIGLLTYIWKGSFAFLLSAPVTYALIVPLLLLDLIATLHQKVCFPLYGIRQVHRADFIALDRHRLSYLNGLEKLNCLFCGYGNGVIAYAREIAGRTEQYWCPIKHAKAVRSPHSRYGKFLDYGDAQGYRNKLNELRKAIDNL